MEASSNAGYVVTIHQLDPYGKDSGDGRDVFVELRFDTKESAIEALREVMRRKGDEMIFVIDDDGRGVVMPAKTIFRALADPGGVAPP